jgi:hypothetical protein
MPITPITLEELFGPGGFLRVPPIIDAPFVSGNTTPLEQEVLYTLVRRNYIHNAFEFGTFDGRSTLTIAQAISDDGKVFTLDLPRVMDAMLPIQDHKNPTFKDCDERGFIGKTEKLFTNHPLQRKIIQIWEDSAQLQTERFPKMNFIFVDASHSYEYVLNDTIKALQLAAPGCIILWHDYPGWPGVKKGLDEALHLETAYHILPTSLVLLKVVL